MQNIKIECSRLIVLFYLNLLLKRYNDIVFYECVILFNYAKMQQKGKSNVADMFP